ncbi:MAG: TRAP transporter small permease subunit [Proteobacteria bacterium]|nr:TRAP transporter small permease subunit [Pseudomonadota bacterium]MBU4275572.1 TRAP transporter small permease subunit [Pseudomonadota bacterium]MBU4382849.1 TRAP transporter small permease subunit [Pseudomonadota bacterium]MBU4604063.1 TRAP transporter small permease subunit [Pseudomonadota bacterium]MCG2765364.1 TRAP transporter small permease subunit [Desulfarculaceae bacterium]
MFTFSRVVRSLNQAMGLIAAPLIGVVAIIVLYEVIVRYFFHAPTSWAQEVCEYLLCALVMFGTGYTLSHYGHTRVDILYSHMSDKARARVEILVGVLLIIAMLPIIWMGGKVAIEAFMVGDTSSSAAALPLGPAKATVPLGAIFLLLQGLANAVENVNFLITGRKPTQS